MPQKHVVKLKAHERLELEQVPRRGRRSARELTRARIPLSADRNPCSDEEAAEASGVGVGTVERAQAFLR